MEVMRKAFPVTEVQWLAARARVLADRNLGYTTPLNILAASKARPGEAVNFDADGHHVVVTLVESPATDEA